ncbi:hypothetical protein MUCCIDRAFT_117461, partial [Mucor lusitanicus CBS 277.49]
GNSRAHVQLGILYDKGEGIPQNNDMALLHYKAAVENNNHAAQYILGLVYYFGRLGRQKNHKEAIRLIKQSAMAGLPYAQRVLGQLYQQGSIMKNEREAIRWYKRAAAGKDVCALGILGKCHEHGIGVDIDLEKALAFYAKAAEGDSPYGHPMSMYSLGLCYYKGIAQEDSKPKLETALEWFEKAARLGVSEAMAYMARIYLQFMVANANQPQLAQQHFVKAVQWLKKSAEKNDTYAQRELGKIYLTGKGLTTDYAMAVHLLSKAAAKNDAEAITFLGDCYHKGTGVDKNMDMAVEHYLRAATLDQFPQAFQPLGCCYLNGTGTPVNPMQAIFWFRKSAEELDDSIAYFNLADIYGSGLVQGVPVDIPLALSYLNKSADMGYTEAQYRMGMIYLQGEYGAEEAAATLIRFAQEEKYGYRVYLQVGECFEQGLGVEKNLRQAFHWY